MSLLRNPGHRQLRTTLTVLGIVIGIWALVVFSSMANKINALVASGSDYYAARSSSVRLEDQERVAAARIVCATGDPVRRGERE